MPNIFLCEKHRNGGASIACIDQVRTLIAGTTTVYLSKIDHQYEWIYFIKPKVFQYNWNVYV